MKEIILIKLGEIVLKGLNRKNFEDALMRNLKRRLAKIGDFHVQIAQSTISISPVHDDTDFDEVEDCVSKVFGIAAFSRACVTEKDIDKIKVPCYNLSVKRRYENDKTSQRTQ